MEGAEPRDERAVDVEQGQARQDDVHPVVDPPQRARHERLVDMAMHGNLRIPRRSAGVEVGARRFGVDGPIGDEPIRAGVCQGLVEVQHPHAGARGKRALRRRWPLPAQGRIETNLQHRMDARDPLGDLHGLVPDVRTWRGAECDQHLGLRFLADARDVRGVQHGVDGARDGRGLRAPQREVALDQVGQQDGHGRAVGQAAGMQRVGRPMHRFE